MRLSAHLGRQPEYMSLLRAFIAADISKAIQQVIQDKIEELRRTIGNTPVRWTPSQNIHLTLKFLGDISPTNVDDLIQLLRAEADICSPFDIHINRLGCFPSSKRPRVLYIGIQSPAELETLQRKIEVTTARYGSKSESRSFSPHLTIGRIRQNATPADQQKIRKALEVIKIDSPGTIRVDSIHLYKSELKPSGAVYTKLFTAPLRTVIADNPKQ